MKTNFMLEFWRKWLKSTSTSSQRKTQFFSYEYELRLEGLLLSRDFLTLCILKLKVTVQFQVSVYILLHSVFPTTVEHLYFLVLLNYLKFPHGVFNDTLVFFFRFHYISNHLNVSFNIEDVSLKWIFLF